MAAEANDLSSGATVAEGGQAAAKAGGGLRTLIPPSTLAPPVAPCWAPPVMPAVAPNTALLATAPLWTPTAAPIAGAAGCVGGITAAGGAGAAATGAAAGASCAAEAQPGFLALLVFFLGPAALGASAAGEVDVGPSAAISAISSKTGAVAGAAAIAAGAAMAGSTVAIGTAAGGAATAPLPTTLAPDPTATSATTKPKPAARLESALGCAAGCDGIAAAARRAAAAKPSMVIGADGTDGAIDRPAKEQLPPLAGSGAAVPAPEAMHMPAKLRPPEPPASTVVGTLLEVDVISRPAKLQQLLAAAAAAPIAGASRDGEAPARLRKENAELLADDSGGGGAAGIPALRNEKADASGAAESVGSEGAGLPSGVGASKPPNVSSESAIGVLPPRRRASKQDKHSGRRGSQASQVKSPSPSKVSQEHLQLETYVKTIQRGHEAFMRRFAENDAAEARWAYGT